MEKDSERKITEMGGKERKEGKWTEGKRKGE